jgi:CheY-like chemotaxis protein
MAKILVVEDDILTKKAIGYLLRGEGYEVYEAEGGLHALSLLAENQFDLVVSDIVMPRIDGFDLLEHASSTSPPTPVLLMTAYSPMQSQVKTRGAAEFILKPFLLDDLLSKIEQVLNQKSNT